MSRACAQVFGEDCGVGTRSAVGVGSLPMNIPFEVELLLEVDAPADVSVPLAPSPPVARCPLRAQLPGLPQRPSARAPGRGRGGG